MRKQLNITTTKTGHIATSMKSYVVSESSQEKKHLVVNNSLQTVKYITETMKMA